MARRHVALALAVLACSTASPPDPRDIAVRVGSVGIDPRSGTPLMLLVEDPGERVLPIWIGFAEASSIAAEIAQNRPPRPNTHDLLTHVISDLEGSVERVIVTELRDGTYFALLIVNASGRRIEIDARPSDAVAVALRTHAPLFVREPLFDRPQDEEPGGDAPGQRT
jgi:bifunctional DNase/RNase